MAIVETNDSYRQSLFDHQCSAIVVSVALKTIYEVQIPSNTTADLERVILSAVKLLVRMINMQNSDDNTPRDRDNFSTQRNLPKLIDPLFEYFFHSSRLCAKYEQVQKEVFKLILLSLSYCFERHFCTEPIAGVLPEKLDYALQLFQDHRISQSVFFLSFKTLKLLYELEHPTF